MKVFLGGTCNESTWRDQLIPLLNIDYFNPVVKDWTSDCIAIENKEKQICDYNLFVLTMEMTGVYSIAEVVDVSNKAPYKTILCILYDGFDEGQSRSLKAVEKLVLDNGAYTFESIEEVAKFLNERVRLPETK